MSKPIYLDYAATTPVAPEVVHEMMKYLDHEGGFGNPSSKHRLGFDADDALESARLKVSEFLCCKPNDIIFTSGATESNNLAIKGVARANKESGNHVITSATEHKAVLDACNALEKEGFNITRLTPDRTGIINLADLENAIIPETVLVSMMHVNNETGVIQNIGELGDYLKDRNIFFHVDAAQSIGKLPINLETDHIDLLSCSSHKLYGPKGAGFLYIKNRAKTKIQPLIDGGGQEFGLRPGTSPTHQIAGLGKAIELAGQQIHHDLEHVKNLNQILINGLMDIEGVTINSSKTSLPNILNISVDGVDSETMVTSLQEDIAISSGSACTSGSMEPSHVLRAMGIEEALLKTAVRISFGRYTTEYEIKTAIKKINDQINRIRRFELRI